RRQSGGAGSLYGAQTMGLLNAAGIVAGYTAADEILKGLDFAVEDREIVCIIGPNGAGKSTLLKAIAALLPPSPRSITLPAHCLAGHAPRKITRLGFAYVTQEHNVFPTMSVRENLEMGGYVDEARTKVRIAEVMERFPMLARKRQHAARTLSGGERQILAMAMALMVQPSVLLLDEPSAGLSPIAAESLFESIRPINRATLPIPPVHHHPT